MLDMQRVPERTHCTHGSRPPLLLPLPCTSPRMMEDVTLTPHPSAFPWLLSASFGHYVSLNALPAALPDYPHRYGQPSPREGPYPFATRLPRAMSFF